VETLIQHAGERLRSQGGRMTSQRRLIFQTLDSLSGHPTAEELYELVRKADPSLNLSTVYRTLNWLEEEGLVSARRFDEEHRQQRFDPLSSHEHHHFLCSHCKQVIEFDHPLIEEIKTQFEIRKDVAVENISMVMYGICAECRRLGKAI